MKLEFANPEHIALNKKPKVGLSWAERTGYYKQSGYQCKHCKFVTTNQKANTYYKCNKHPITNGPGTDIRLKDPACILFEIKGALNYEPDKSVY